MGLGWVCYLPSPLALPDIVLLVSFDLMHGAVQWAAAFPSRLGLHVLLFCAAAMLTMVVVILSDC